MTSCMTAKRLGVPVERVRAVYKVESNEGTI